MIHKFSTLIHCSDNGSEHRLQDVICEINCGGRYLLKSSSRHPFSPYLSATTFPTTEVFYSPSPYLDFKSIFEFFYHSPQAFCPSQTFNSAPTLGSKQYRPHAIRFLRLLCLLGPCQLGEHLISPAYFYMSPTI